MIKVFVIGSVSREADIKSVADFYLALGSKVEYVKRQPDKTLECLIKDALKCISEADMVVAVQKPDGTLGEGTTYEMAFAKHLKKITWEFTADEIDALKRKASKETKKYKIIAVDFDGTLCEDRYPYIGASNRGLIRYLKEQQKDGAKIILWSCRVGDKLAHAVYWCSVHGLVFDAVNENYPEVIKKMGSDTRKIFADEYIDDQNAWYTCGDRRACGEKCSYPKCMHTKDITHAENFERVDGTFIEKYHAKFTSRVTERRNAAMNYFLAVNNKQLGICLRMLFAEGIQGNVKTVLNGKSRIEFHIYANADEQTLKMLMERYRILVS